MMLADDVLSVLAVLRNADTDVWIGGGWGIDALVGRQTRPHRDLDLMHRKGQEPAVVAALAEAGFTETLDWRPVRFAVTDPRGREDKTAYSPYREPRKYLADDPMSVGRSGC